MLYSSKFLFGHESPFFLLHFFSGEEKKDVDKDFDRAYREYVERMRMEMRGNISEDVKRCALEAAIHCGRRAYVRACAKYAEGEGLEGPQAVLEVVPNKGESDFSRGGKVERAIPLTHSGTELVRAVGSYERSVRSKTLGQVISAMNSVTLQEGKIVKEDQFYDVARDDIDAEYKMVPLIRVSMRREYSFPLFMDKRCEQELLNFDPCIMTLWNSSLGPVDLTQVVDKGGIDTIIEIIEKFYGFRVPKKYYSQLGEAITHSSVNGSLSQAGYALKGGFAMKLFAASAGLDYGSSPQEVNDDIVKYQSVQRLAGVAKEAGVEKIIRVGDSVGQVSSKMLVTCFEALVGVAYEMGELFAMYYLHVKYAFCRPLQVPSLDYLSAMDLFAFEVDKSIFASKDDYTFKGPVKYYVLERSG